jgi:hypothetical protein
MPPTGGPGMPPPGDPNMPPQGGPGMPPPGGPGMDNAFERKLADLFGGVTQMAQVITQQEKKIEMMGKQLEKVEATLS